MLAIQQNPGQILPLLGFILGIAIFVGTLLLVWNNRTDATTLQAAKTGALVAFVVGLLGMLWAMSEDESVFPLAFIVVTTLCMAPTFVISFYWRLVWLQRSGAARGQD